MCAETRAFNRLSLASRLKAILPARRGNVAVLSALAMLPIALAGTMAIETSLISEEKSQLQAAVDAGALAGASELSLASRGTDGIITTATTVARENLTPSMSGGASKSFTATVDRSQGEVTVVGRVRRQSVLGTMGIGEKEIVATATAESLQTVPLCILQTTTKAANRLLASGFKVNDRASINATGCLVHANENITVAPDARIEATRVQAVGTTTGTIMPVGNNGAMAIRDPFAGMNLNPPRFCGFKNPKRSIAQGTTVTLQPGLHCEAIEVLDDATLKLAPGEHYFFGDLDLKGASHLEGEDVALIFGGFERFSFAGSSHVNLSARLTGPFAGFLIATHQTNIRAFTIASENVNELLGTIYIPSAELVIESAGSVAEESAWSVIVARAITLKNNPRLVINTGYVGSGVPVPEGVGPGNNEPKLTR